MAASSDIPFNDFVGAEKQGSDSSSLVQSPRGSAPTIQNLSFEEFTGAAPESKGGFNHEAAYDTAVEKIKDVGGTAAFLVDFAAGIPGWLMGTGAQLTGTLAAAARGVPLTADKRMLNPVTAYGVGREVGQQFQGFTPMKSLLDMVRQGKIYDESSGSKGMQKLISAVDAAGEWVEQATDGKVARDSVPMMVDTLLASMGGLKKEKSSPVTPAMRKGFQKAWTEYTTKKEAAEAQPATPDERAAIAPVQQQINSLLGITSPEEKIAQMRKRRKDVAEAFKKPAEGSDYGTIDESQFRADERMRNSEDYQRQSEAAGAEADTSSPLDTEAVPARPERIGQAEILRIMQKPGHERTAEDLITLREARKQGGKASTEALMLMSAAGIGAAGGAVLDDDVLRGAVLGGSAALAPAALMTKLGGGVESRFKQAGAVKGPGGMWHPEAVERLAGPLAEKLKRTEDALADIPEGQKITKEELDKKFAPTDQWANKAVNNYLNRYAGTDRDPLKDVEVPKGEGTARWEDLWNNSVGKANKEGILENKPGNADGVEGGIWSYFPEAEKMRPGESVHNFGAFVGGAGRGSSEAITSYLSHVGDYLRQNVKLEELSRYDLVRAVKETAENDKRVVKQMEKAQAASAKDLPVYKEYKDGFKWVELKLPEKLTEEQLKTVRQVKEGTPEWKQLSHKADMGGEGELVAGRDTPWIALGPDAKPVHNAFTGDIAGGPGPKEAILAKWLAEEGNQMGHCVGGYCPSVASGESRIFSLRDAKGKSHVTVEVDPNKSHMLSGERMNQLTGDPKAFEKYKESAYFKRNAGDIHGFFKDKYPEAYDRFTTPSIAQIKGKQNRAPNKEYLPYVQDFVKSGKWEDVGDLENTGLYPHKINGSTIYPREWAGRDRDPMSDTGKFLSVPPEALDLKPGYYTEPEFREAAKEAFNKDLDFRFDPKAQNPGGREQGKADPQLVLGLSAIGLGGLVGAYASQDKGTGALLGALAGGVMAIPGTRKRFAEAVEKADWGLGLLSTRIGNISPSVLLRAREYEMRTLTQAHELLHKVAPFMERLAKVGGDKGKELQRALLTNDRDAVAKLMQGNKPLVEAWRETRNVLNDLGEKLAGQGRFKSLTDDYFPRLVKDFEGLKGALEQPLRVRVEEKLMAAEKDAVRTRGQPLTSIEQGGIINAEIQGFYRSKAQQPGFTHGRKVKEVTEQLQQFYHTPSESLYAYVRGAVQDLEMSRLFGRDLVETKRGGQSFISVDESIGNLVGRELKEGKITHPEAQQLIDMMKARFSKGDMSPSRLVQSVRNIANAGLLGNIVSAATQLADTAIPIYAQGFRSTMTALARQLSGRAKVTAADFGLADHIAEEFVGASKTADVLNRVLKYSGFSAIDRFGKTTLLNAAHDKLTRWAQNDSPALARKYKEAFGGEYANFVQDLKDGKLSDDVRLALFSELSDYQPISKLEVPQAYLEHPNGRILYMLKTFMMKQMDVIRRDAYNEMKKGDLASVARGLKNLTSYAAVLGISGAATDVVKNWLMGRPMSFNGNDIAENVLKTFGFGEYMRDKMKKNPSAVLGAFFLPPYQMMDQIITADPKAVQYVPLIGKLYYNWEMGGREQAELREAKQAKKAGKEFPISGRAEQYKERIKEERRERKERYPGPGGVRG